MKRLLLYFIFTILLTACGTYDGEVTCTSKGCFDSLSIRLIPENDSGFLDGKYLFAIDAKELGDLQCSYDIENGELLNDEAVYDPSYHDYRADCAIINSDNIITVSFGFDFIGVNSNDSIEPELTDIEIDKDGTIIYSGEVAPQYDRYWCNAKSCDPRKNFNGAIDVQL